MIDVTDIDDDHMHMLLVSDECSVIRSTIHHDYIVRRYCPHVSCYYIIAAFTKVKLSHKMRHCLVEFVLTQYFIAVWRGTILSIYTLFIVLFIII
jgi:hypothetical protein